MISHADGRDDPGDIALGIVFGRAVLNVRLILSVGAGLPGTNAGRGGSGQHIGMPRDRHNPSSALWYTGALISNAAIHRMRILMERI
jgi:hypothetical protein